MINKFSLYVLAMAMAAAISAQPAATTRDPANAEEFDFPTVAAAHAALNGRWELERFYRGDGWLGFSDSRNKTIWAFAPVGHPAYPAVVKRAILDDGKGPYIKTTARCEAAKAACDELLLEFRALDVNAPEYLQFQNRNSSANLLKEPVPPQSGK